MKVIIATSLNKKVCRGSNSFQLISFKKLSRKEVSLARKFGIRRFYLPKLNNIDSERFFHEFDVFWDKVVAEFGSEHPFWRNVVSSKMQAWGDSVGYLCLVLFTLTRLSDKENAKLIIVCNSLEMRKICLQWANNNGWQVIAGEIKSELYGRCLQKAIDLKCFSIQFIEYLLKKMQSAGLSIDVRHERRAVLIPSLFYPDSFKNGLYNDPFFGRLHDYIKNKDFQCVYFCESLNRVNRLAIKKASQCRDATIFTPYTLLSWKKTIEIFLSLYFRKLEIPRSIFMGCDFSTYICWYSGNFRYSFNIDAELYFESVKLLCGTYKFNRLILSYEGNVYERACIQAFRELNSGKIIGYSHAVIYPLNLKIRLTDKEASSKPGPDFYICTGSYNKELLEKAGKGYNTAQFRDGCVLKEVPAVKTKNNIDINNRKILIALDGLETTIVLLEWVLEHLQALKDFTFRVRFHPNISGNSILNQCINSFPDNIEISDMDLKQDIEESMCVLYRHSSVGIQAILNGLPAVHLAIDSPLCGDPLKDLIAYKWSVNSLSELETAIEEIRSLSPEQKEASLNTASIFARKYFTNPAEEVLNEFIS